MKKWQMVVVVFMFMFWIGGTVEADTVPKIGNYIIGNPPSGEKGNHLVKAEFPILKRQRISNPNWQLSASWAWYNPEKEKWILVPLGNYSLANTEPKSELLIGSILVPIGVEWYWPRVWGKEVTSKQWLLPDEKHLFYRESITNKPAYEFLVNIKTGHKKPVPSFYQKRP